MRSYFKQPKVIHSERQHKSNTSSLDVTRVVSREDGAFGEQAEELTERPALNQDLTFKAFTEQHEYLTDRPANIVLRQNQDLAYHMTNNVDIFSEEI